MEDILYLVHSTYKYNDTWDELKKSSFDIYQFPGVYFTLITKDNTHNEVMYSTTNLIFSKKLLLQNNYHINYSDNNGHINEYNTYYPWNIEKVVKRIAANMNNPNDKRKHMNEVVFHDNVPMSYLCAVVQNISRTSYYDSGNNNYQHLFSKFLLPKYSIFNDIEPDMTKIPFYCYPYEENYTGPYPYEASSKKFYEKMALMCKVNKNQSRKKIKEAIRKKIDLLYNNRELLQIEEFK